jgi:hypothetical protein
MGRPYRSARLRLERAIAHGERIAQLWNKIPNEVLCTPKARFVDVCGNGEVVATNVGVVPDELSLLLGEHLYQLRSALDSCIYQATVYATGKNPPPDENQLEFPITFNPAEWPRLTKRRLDALPTRIQQMIELVQPFNALTLPPAEMLISIGRSLGILNDLARKDRHRQIHIVGSWPIDSKPDFDLPQGVSVSSLKVMPPNLLQEGTVIATFHLDGFIAGMRVGVNPKLRTNFGCGEPPPACHPEDTFDHRIAEMINAVGSVLVAFETHY